MREDLGRFFEGRLLETTQTLKTIYDAGTGQGKDVAAWVDGRELVFSRGEGGSGNGFMRAIPGEVNVIVAFPRGHELFDPQKRAKGPRGSRTTMIIGHSAEVDVYVRRLITGAYSIEDF